MVSSIGEFKLMMLLLLMMFNDIRLRIYLRSVLQNEALNYYGLSRRNFCIINGCRDLGTFKVTKNHTSLSAVFETVYIIRYVL